MSRPFTVDLSDYYGQPDFREQDSSTIVDRRKMLNLHKKLETGMAAEVTLRSKKGTTRPRKGADSNSKPFGDAVAFNSSAPVRNSPASSTPGGALTFNE